eukprot:10786860-Alexandrium_andersonii.AAC.1
MATKPPKSRSTTNWSPEALVKRSTRCGIFRHHEFCDLALSGGSRSEPLGSRVMSGGWTPFRREGRSDVSNL